MAEEPTTSRTPQPAGTRPGANTYSSNGSNGSNGSGASAKGPEAEPQPGSDTKDTANGDDSKKGEMKALGGEA